MPLIDAAGTSVARIRPDSVKNSMPPERIWLSMSVSEPSWLLGKICGSKRPLVSALIAAAISLARTFIGCASGRLFAYLYVTAACARATNGAPIPPKTAEAADALSSARREKFIWFSLRSCCSCETVSYGAAGSAATSRWAYCSVRRLRQYRAHEALRRLRRLAGLAQESFRKVRVTGLAIWR